MPRRCLAFRRFHLLSDENRFRKSVSCRSERVWWRSSGPGAPLPCDVVKTFGTPEADSVELRPVGESTEHRRMSPKLVMFLAGSMACMMQTAFTPVKL
jgi:hypothetical protein